MRRLSTVNLWASIAIIAVLIRAANFALDVSNPVVFLDNRGAWALALLCAGAVIGISVFYFADFSERRRELLGAAIGVIIQAVYLLLLPAVQQSNL